MPTLTIMDTTIDKSGLVIGKLDYFLVKWGNMDKKEIDSAIEQYVKLNFNPATNPYNQYEMLFFEESSETNIENIKNNPRVIDRYSMGHDLLYEYVWQKDEFLAKHEYKDGEIVDHNHNKVIIQRAHAEPMKK